MQACCSQDEAIPAAKPLHIHRRAEMFEALRAATDAYHAKTGQRPQVFPASMGSLLQHKARTDFSRSFFAVGGFELIANDGFHTVEDAASAASSSQAPVVVICSTDEVYPDLVPSLTQQIKTANPETIVLLAGYPKEHLELFKNAGVDEFIHLRANAYEILAKLLKRLNILT
jgi:methylmalonyl-CoA mutase